jgi:hypothetical protein
MKTAALKKKRLAVVEVPADPLRAALAQAISARAKADALVAQRLEAIQAAKENTWAAEERIEKLAAKIPEAESADIARAASTLAKNTAATVPISWQADSARSALKMEKDRLRLTQAAIVKLESDLVGLQDDAAEAASEVLITIKRITLPTAQTLLTETTALKAKLAVNLQVLGELVHEDVRLSFNKVLRGEKAREKREAVLQDVRRGTERLHFAGSVDDYNAAAEASAKWRQALTALQTNPDAELPS